MYFSVVADGVPILEKIDLPIKEGEMISVIGKNGSGKSTFLNLLAGILQPTQGNIWVDDCNTRKKQDFIALRRKIGIVFQNPDNQILFPKVYDDLEFALKNLGLENRKERIEEALKLVNMKDFMEKDSYELSLGQKQRINIASVLAIRPKYIVLDEPTTMLDSSEKENFYQILKRLKKEGYTVIFVTNNMDEILLADQIFVMKNRQISFIFRKEDMMENVNLFEECGIKLPKLVQAVRRLAENHLVVNLKEWTMEEFVDQIVRIKKSEKYS